MECKLRNDGFASHFGIATLSDSRLMLLGGWSSVARTSGEDDVCASVNGISARKSQRALLCVRRRAGDITNEAMHEHALRWRQPHSGWRNEHERSLAYQLLL